MFSPSSVYETAAQINLDLVLIQDTLQGAVAV